MKCPPKLSISYGDYSLKQYSTAEYLGCYLDSNLNKESMARRVLKKINIKLNFSWKQSNYLKQPHFDYGCTSWYPLLSKALKTELQIAQNKSICFYLELPSRGHINPPHFRKINWLLVEHRVELCTSTTVFKYWKRIAPSYLNDMFMPSLNNYDTRSQMALDIPLCRTIKGQKNMSFLGPKIWNKVSTNIKTTATASSFMHCLKKGILSKLQESAILLIFLFLLLLLFFSLIF